MITTAEESDRSPNRSTQCSFRKKNIWPIVPVHWLEDDDLQSILVWEESCLVPPHILTFAVLSFCVSQVLDARSFRYVRCTGIYRFSLLLGSRNPVTLFPKDQFPLPVDL